MTTDPLIGKQVNNFVIRERIGQGGMATVYLAYQPSVNRQVALKIITLNAVPSERDEFRLRFAQEAQVIASLEHVHILPVYDYGIFDNEIAYIAMRLLRGGTLADVLGAGLLELDRTAEIFSQIALGLSYAHRKGVIHRDLKPSNILMDEAGYAYLSDFGLAKIVENSLNLTRSDTVVGTPTYMSPEQLRGEVLDNRSDIYSLGCILYHMLVGRQPFADSSTGIASIIYQQLEKDPKSPHELNPKVTPEVEQVVLRALSKKREDRYATADEMANALNKALGRELRSHDAGDETHAASRVSEDLPTLVESADLLIKLPPSGGNKLEDLPMITEATESTARPKLRSRVATGGILVAVVAVVLVAAFAVLNQNGQPTLTPTPIEAAMLETSLAGSIAATTLPTLPSTETESTLAPSPTLASTIVSMLPLLTDTVAPTERPTLPPADTESTAAAPTLASTQAVGAPGGEQGQIAFVSDRDGNSEIYVMNLDGTGIQRLTNDPAKDEYPSWSPDGSQIAFMSDRDDPCCAVVYVMDADGSNLHRLTDAAQNTYYPAWSPDGTQIALTIYGESAQIYLVDSVGSNLRPVSNLPANVGLASWSPDGETIVFMGDGAGNQEIYMINVDGTGLRTISSNPAPDANPAWSPLGDLIAFQSDRINNNAAIFLMDSAGENVRLLSDDGEDGYDPTWSPDGKQVAFMSYRYGYGAEIYIMNVDGTGERRITDSEGSNQQAAWRP